ncbi:MAG: hypothetical protein WAN03_09415 [Candidatus Sulfotelmatobacter sp.]
MAVDAYSKRSSVVGRVTVNGPWNYETPTTPLTISENTGWDTNAATPNTGPGGFYVIQLGAKVYF